MFKRPVIGAFGLRGKTAGRKFLITQMILQASAAGSLARTGFIGTIAVLFILLRITVHNFDPLIHARFVIQDSRIS
jgi:hypothetical protein